MPASSPRDHHHRRSIRLPDYDYSQSGAYFVTVCTQQREALFGAVVGDVVRLNEYGEIVAAVWHDLPRHYAHVTLDTFVVMPNHAHGIIILDNVVGGVGAGPRPAPTEPAPTEPALTAQRPPLSEIVRAFKSFSARRINEVRNTRRQLHAASSTGIPVWQRNYYERVIRSDRELNAVREYIQRNPLNWARDHENPQSRR